MQVDQVLKTIRLILVLNIQDREFQEEWILHFYLISILIKEQVP